MQKVLLEHVKTTDDDILRHGGAIALLGPTGVGKTTTARILARALNDEKPDGSVKGPTIHMPDLGVHCKAIMESRHMDVLEMDAASHTGMSTVGPVSGTPARA
jgi:DNA polymerase-3 subunit gamma/tau